MTSIVTGETKKASNEQQNAVYVSSFEPSFLVIDHSAVNFHFTVEQQLKLQTICKMRMAASDDL